MGKDRILVVDDDPDNRAMITHFLSSWGFIVDATKNGRIALERVDAEPPNLIWLDLEMPEMDGFEACERLKTNPKTEWIPVIIIYWFGEDVAPDPWVPARRGRLCVENRGAGRAADPHRGRAETHEEIFASGRPGTISNTFHSTQSRSTSPSRRVLRATRRTPRSRKLFSSWPTG